MTQAVLLSKGTLIYDEEVCGENMFSNNEGKKRTCNGVVKDGYLCIIMHI